METRVFAEPADASNAMVKGSGYREVAESAEGRMDPTAFCRDCQHFIEVGKDRSPCQVIKMGTVAAGGWCRNFQRRARPIKVKS